MKIRINENLGQVWTSDAVAKLMMDIVKGELRNSDSILDPCVGPNTFFKNGGDLTNFKLTGFDIDLENLSPMQIEQFNISKQNFFDHPVSNKYEAVIMNPPYVRQEDIVDSTINSKRKIKDLLEPVFGDLNGKNNLYIYFILKGILHLKESGVLAAIVYDSWLYSQFGNEFRSILAEHGTISHLIHFTNEAFENADVGATVIIFRKCDDFTVLNVKEVKSPSHLSSDIPYREILWKDFVKNGLRKQSILHYNHKIFDKLESLSERKVKRGTNTIISGGLVVSNSSLKDLFPIVKSISKQHKFEINETAESIVLNTNGCFSKETLKYLDTLANKYISEGTKKGLIRRIQGSNDWFKISPKEPGNFIFNYYIRKSTQFLYNPKEFIASENFYQLHFSSNQYAYLSILNSSLTKLAIIEKSRKQGKGLLKCQMYEFRKVSILNPLHMPTKIVEELTVAGKSLSKLNRDSEKSKEVLKMVDEVLIEYYNNCTGERLSKNEVVQELKQWS